MIVKEILKVYMEKDDVPLNINYRFGDFSFTPKYHPTIKEKITEIVLDELYSGCVHLISYDYYGRILDNEVFNRGSIFFSHLGYMKGMTIIILGLFQKQDAFYLLKEDLRIYVETGILIPLNAIENLSHQYGLY